MGKEMSNSPNKMTGQPNMTSFNKNLTLERAPPDIIYIYKRLKWGRKSFYHFSLLPASNFQTHYKSHAVPCSESTLKSVFNSILICSLSFSTLIEIKHVLRYSLS